MICSRTTRTTTKTTAFLLFLGREKEKSVRV
jgi:hypothetical protein